MTKLRMLCANTNRQIRHFFGNESGATSIEYAMIAAGIAVVIVVTVASLGSSVKGKFTSASNALN